MAEPLAVHVRDCSTHPDGHSIFLSATLPFAAGYAAERQVFALNGAAPDVLIGAWLDTFIRHGVTGWDLCDAEGEPLPFDVEAVLSDYTLSRPVAVQIEELGWDSQVLDPLLARLPKRSRTGQTAPSTSRTPRQTRKPSA